MSINVAWVDLKLHLHRRYDPFSTIGEYIVRVFFESYSAPTKKMETTLISFGGREEKLVPVGGGNPSQDTIEQRNSH
jgi:hypothetical protein